MHAYGLRRAARVAAGPTGTLTHAHSQVEIIEVEAIQSAYAHRLLRYRQTQSNRQQRAEQ